MLHGKKLIRVHPSVVKEKHTQAMHPVVSDDEREVSDLSLEYSRSAAPELSKDGLESPESQTSDSDFEGPNGAGHKERDASAHEAMQEPSELPVERNVSMGDTGLPGDVAPESDDDDFYFPAVLSGTRDEVTSCHMQEGEKSPSWLYCLLPKEEVTRRALRKQGASYVGIGDMYAASLAGGELAQLCKVVKPLAMVPAPQSKKRKADSAEGHVCPKENVQVDQYWKTASQQPEVKEAMDQEIQGWDSRGVYDVVSEREGQRWIQTGLAQCISTRWVVTDKALPDGGGTRKKARCCLRGYEDNRQLVTTGHKCPDNISNCAKSSYFWGSSKGNTHHTG